MGTSSLIMGILPLLVFVIVDSFSSIKWALISAVCLAIAELIFSLVVFGTIDIVTWASFFLVALLSYLSWHKKSDLFFLFQPVVLSAGTGLFMVISYAFGKPLMLVMAQKYAHALPIEMRVQLTVPTVQLMLKNISLTSGLFLFLHAGVTAWAALKLSKWWWIAIRGIGFYLFMFLSFLTSQLWVKNFILGP